MLKTNVEANAEYYANQLRNSCIATTSSAPILKKEIEEELEIFDEVLKQ